MMTQFLSKCVAWVLIRTILSHKLLFLVLLTPNQKVKLLELPKRKEIKEIYDKKKIFEIDKQNRWLEFGGGHKIISNT